MMAGMLAARRRRRLAPFPSTLRPVALMMCSDIFVTRFACNGPPRGGKNAHPRPDERWLRSRPKPRPQDSLSIDVQRAHRFAEGDAADRFGQQFRHAELADAAAGPRRFAE